ncbi:hypothetical protein [Chryseobacterium echinoideorum]|uniref:hypothetical protein n=1 Tax=Chryseobacterium echinoideorum TaxID=1549648 RepID=UPI001186539A|nr:hypothetical protein [Chryseobacterium echinoideorum]
MIDFIQILLQFLLILIGFYLALFKSYFQEKGKNIATKEDIEEITQKVEKIKTDLNYSTQNKISLKSEEKKSLIEYYEKYYQFQNYLSDVTLVGIYENNEEKIRNIEEKIEQYKSDYDMASAKIELLIDNFEFIQKTRELKLQTIKYNSLISEYIGNIEKLFIEVRSVLKLVSLSEQKEKIKELYKQRSDYYKELNDKKLEHYKIQYEIENKIRQDIYDMLQKHIIV